MRVVAGAELTVRQREPLNSLASGSSFHLHNDPIRDELEGPGLVEWKLGGWGLTSDGKRALVTGRV